MESGDVQFETGAKRADASEKSRPDLISPFFKDRVGQHLRLGALRYAEDNWQKGIPFRRCIASLERHLMQYEMGDETEDHLSGMACNVMFLIHFEEAIKRGLLPASLDDMPHYLHPRKETACTAPKPLRNVRKKTSSARTRSGYNGSVA